MNIESLIFICFGLVFIFWGASWILNSQKVAKSQKSKETILGWRSVADKSLSVQTQYVNSRGKIMLIIGIIIFVMGIIQLFS